MDSQFKFFDIYVKKSSSSDEACVEARAGAKDGDCNRVAVEWLPLYIECLLVCTNSNQEGHTRILPDALENDGKPEAGACGPRPLAFRWTKYLTRYLSIP
ncbi:uncharacterized protein RAG0_11006 [Rhynchosporium agropyri]|uniref:Uncharacterized protein n=1 Tax=Rhynchosporium agropyri TaxID=914238 RepID=A0A1E1L265_9HELO|nr:uncharacterized protein RAG0_11006 [Rhynchosporium agropyri]